MSYETANYEDQDPVGDAMYWLREPLECEQLGLTVVECPPGWTGKEHDHAHDGQEEVYLLLSGEATIDVDGEAVALESGDAIRVDPDSTRQLRNGESESTFVIAGAP